MKRRTFLSALSGIMVGPALLRLARAEQSKPPARLLILFKPCGTVPEAYHPSMSGGRLWLSPILAPLESVREEMTVVGGLDNLKKPNTPGQDHGNGMVTFMTGGETTTYPAFLAVIAERMSIDQIFARDRAFSGDSVFKSIQLAADIRSRLGAHALRVVGRPDMQVTKVALAPGAAGFAMHRAALQRDDVQVLVIGEAREWETVEYVDDAVAAGQEKALVIIGHIPSEQAGMEECARWLKGFVTEVPVEFVPAADPFWESK